MRYEVQLVGRVMKRGNAFVAQVIDRAGTVLNESEPVENRKEAKRLAEQLESEELLRRLR